jgi:hypothetical protein
MKNTKHSISRHKSRSARHPSSSDRKARKARRIRAKWSARILRQGSLTGPAFIEFTFPTKGGGTSQFRANHSNMRSRHLNTLLDQFSNYLPIFPADVGLTDKAQGQFIQELVAGAANSIELLPERTGFIDAATFVTHTEILHADGTRTRVPRNNDPARHTFVDTKGTLQGTTDLVLKLANESTYLAFGIAVALAAPLPSYVNLRRTADDGLAPLVRETAVFNLSGTSSSGKSSVCLAAITLAERPSCRAGRHREG